VITASVAIGSIGVPFPAHHGGAGQHAGDRGGGGTTPPRTLRRLTTFPVNDAGSGRRRAHDRSSMVARGETPQERHAA
jgi:hypothetical protein